MRWNVKAKYIAHTLAGSLAMGVALGQSPSKQAGTLNPGWEFLVADFRAGADSSPQNMVYLAPTTQVHLPPAKISTMLTQTGSGYTLTLSAGVVARDAYLTFGDLDATPSDNYFDLLPNETLQITVHTTASKAQLESELKLVSLVDLFGANTSAVQGAK